MTIAETRPRAVEPRTLAFWLMAVAIVLGLWLTVKDMLPSMRAFPASTAVNLVFLVVSFALGLWLVRRVLRPVQAPPWPGTWLAVLWGGLAACSIALLLNGMLISAWSRALSLETGSAWYASLTAPINEEFAKAAGVVLLTAVSTRLIRSAADGFVFGALVGFGFQVFENFGYGYAQVIALGGVDPAAATTQALVIRFIITGLGSHWTMSAVAGAGIGYLVGAVARPLARRVWVAIGCMLLAMAMHFQFDSPLSETFLPPIGGTLINFVVVLIVYRVVRRRFRTRWEAVTEREVQAGVIEPEEAQSLSRRRTRKKYLRGFPAGPEREAAAGRQRAQLELVENRVPADAEDR